MKILLIGLFLFIGCSNTHESQRFWYARGYLDGYCNVVERDVIPYDNWGLLMMRFDSLYINDTMCYYGGDSIFGDCGRIYYESD